MVNTAQQGARLERAVRLMFDKRGYFTARAAGSKGTAKADLFAFHPDHGTVLIQCKLSDPLISPAERLGLTTVANICYAVPVVAYKDKGKIRFRELTGPGPKEWREWAPQGEERDDDE